MYSLGFTYSGRFGFFSLYFFVITLASTDFFTGGSKSLTLILTGLLPLLLVPDLASNSLFIELDGFSPDASRSFLNWFFALFNSFLLRLSA